MVQSWGTIIGMKYLEKHSENVSAYLGIGQATQFARGKVYSVEKASQVARNQGKKEEAEKLDIKKNQKQIPLLQK